MIACKNSQISVFDHFNQTVKLIDIGKGGSTELAANLFRATQTEDKLKRENIKGKQNANRVHFQVEAKVRKTIEELGGTMPEDLPAVESIHKIKKQEKLKKISDK